MPSLSLANNTFKACRFVPPFSPGGLTRELLSIVVALFHVGSLTPSDAQLALYTRELDP